MSNPAEPAAIKHLPTVNPLNPLNLSQATHTARPYATANSRNPKLTVVVPKEIK